MYNLFIVFFTYITISTAQITTDPKKHPNFHLLPQPPHCSNSYNWDHIASGEFAEMGQFPWMARLGYVLQNCQSQADYPIFNCGGSLIASKFVITAGHCTVFIGQPRCRATHNYETALLQVVRLGDYDLTKSIDCENNICADEPQEILIERIIRHENFNSSTLSNDITILELKKEAKINEWVNPVCLPFGNVLFQNFTNSIAEMAGWGRINNSNRIEDRDSHLLKCIYLVIHETFVCAKYFFMSNDNGSQICAGGENGHDSCSGDSGGPLMIVGNESGTPTVYQIGIVSFGYKICGIEGLPAVYTDVRFYINWILDHLTK